VHSRYAVIGVMLILFVHFPMVSSAEVRDETSLQDFDLILEEGFWNRVGNVTVWENLTIHNRGMIVNHGHLIIRNCTIVLDPKPLLRADLQNYNRTWIEDIDGDPGTPEDASKIISMDHNRAGLMESNNQAGLTRISNSYMEGMFIAGDRLDIHGSELINVSIMGYLAASTVKDVRMIGNGSGTAISKGGPADMEINNLTIINYDLAIDVQGGGFSVIGSNITDCRQGMISLEDELYVRDTELHDCTRPIHGYDLITLVNVSISGGSVDLPPGSVMNIQESRFTDMDRIANLTGGVVRGSIFEGCSIAVMDAVRSRFIRNRFVGNDVAFSEPRDCELFHNAFIENRRVVEGLTLSTWYNKTLGEGNYYDIYTGQDNGQDGRRAFDGIGDTGIPFLGRDPYPLMQDRQWSMAVIPELDIIYYDGSASVLLIWNGSGASKYILQRSRTSDFSKDVRTWSLNSPGTVVKDNPNATVHFRVRSFNEIGSRGWSIPVSVDVDRDPLTPVHIEVEPLPEGRSLSVSWELVGEDIEKTLIFFSPNEVDYQLVQVFYPGTSHTLEDLKNGVRYSIILVTVDLSGHVSEQSSVINAVPLDELPPPHPRNLRGTPRGNDTIRLEWDPPLVQDIWGYIVYRRGPGEAQFREITRLSKNVLFYEDHDLLDNTTYEYSLSSVDDDGPVSERSPFVPITTDHFNSRPIFIGVELILYLVEDEGPLKSQILHNFSDPDGDELTFSVLEYFPFPSRISDGSLWIIPEKDQAGEGYVQISISDGEEAVHFLIGIIVGSVEDEPRNVRIISPLNGTVLLPDNPVTLEASGYDPDMVQGDRLNVTWSSDRDGILFESTQSVLRTIRDLSPGIHLLTLRVEDRTGNVRTDEVTVIVSLWGWGDVPWKVEVNEDREMLADAPFLELLMKNDSPLVLRFGIEGTLNLGEGVRLQERNILVGPRSDGIITLEFPPGLESGREYRLELIINAQTINGTYGGTSTLTYSFTPGVPEEDQNGQATLIIVISTISLIAVIGLVVFFLFNLRKNREEAASIEEDRKGDY